MGTGVHTCDSGHRTQSKNAQTCMCGMRHCQSAVPLSLSTVASSMKYRRAFLLFLSSKANLYIDFSTSTSSRSQWALREADRVGFPQELQSLRGQHSLRRPHRPAGTLAAWHGHPWGSRETHTSSHSGGRLGQSFIP